jgi:glycosyltransferase involved in cell wall biosynthesis
MNVNFVMWDMCRSGGIRVLFEVGNRLERRGHNVTFTALGFPGSHSWFPLRGPQVTYAETRSGRLVSGAVDRVLPKLGMRYFMDRVRLLSQAIPEDTEVNIATYCFTAFAVHRSAKGKPAYYIQHYEPLFFKDRYLKNMADETYNLPLRWVVNSSWVRSLLNQRFQKDGKLIIPGVDLRVFYRRDVPSEGTARTVISLGKSAATKDVGTLFASLKLVRQEVPNLQLLLYGSQPWMTKYSSVPCRYIVHPCDEELARLYSASDISVTSSMYESSPLPPLEAMACGTPVVTSRFGTEDYCFHDENSLVVSPHNPKLMAEAIIRVLTEPGLAERLRSEGLETVRKFSWEETASQFETFLRGIIET